MLSVLLLQNGECHIVNYRNNKGGYRTICNKSIEKNTIMNTFSVDDSFSGICDICKKHSDDMTLSYLNYAKQLARTHSTSHYPNELECNRMGLRGPDVYYEDVVDHRSWYKLSKYQRLVLKAKSKGRKNKSKYKRFKFL